MKASILIAIVSLCGAFAANACPTQANDWISGKWNCKSENPENSDVPFELVLKNKTSVAVLKMKGSTPTKIIKLDGPLAEKNEHVLVDGGESEHYNKISYNATCDDRQNKISVQFRMTYNTATKFLLNYIFTEVDSAHLNILVQKIDNDQEDNHLSCTRID